MLGIWDEYDTAKSTAPVSFGENCLVGDFVKACTLDLYCNTIELSLQRFSRGREHHLLSDFGVVWRPGDEADFVPLSFRSDIIFEIIDSPSALARRQISYKCFKVAFFGSLLDDDLRQSLVEVVDDVLRLLAQFEILENCDAFV